MPVSKPKEEKGFLLEASAFSKHNHSPLLRWLESKKEEAPAAPTSGGEGQTRDTAKVGSEKTATEAEDGKEIILQGFLKKQTHSRFNKYKKRWCVLTADSLTYYPDKVSLLVFVSPV